MLRHLVCLGQSPRAIGQKCHSNASGKRLAGVESVRGPAVGLGHGPERTEGVRQGLWVPIIRSWALTRPPLPC